jgi:hypothetical protein
MSPTGLPLNPMECVFFRTLTLIEDDLDLCATCVSVKQRFGNRRRGEGIGLHQDRALGIAQGLHNGVGAVPTGE